MHTNWIMYGNALWNLFAHTWTVVLEIAKAFCLFSNQNMSNVHVNIGIWSVLLFGETKYYCKIHQFLSIPVICIM